MNLMKKHGYLLASGLLFIVFIVFTILVKTVDVHYFQVTNTYLGFYGINDRFNSFVVKLGKYNSMNTFSNVFLYISFAYVAVLLVVAIINLVKVKSLKKLDKRFYLLLGGYVVLAIFYLIFEVCKINYAPNSTPNALKASYPSTHVFIGCLIFLLNSYTAVKLLKPEKEWIPFVIYAGTGVICVLMIFTRSLSLHHWLTDIIASIILIPAIYAAFLYVSHKILPEKELKETAE